MPKFLRMVLAVVAGFMVGSLVNMALILVGGQLVPPPAGADVASMAGLKSALPLFDARHFVFPFLAHALGTFVGACLAGWLAPAKSAVPACIVGGLFLLGGIANAFMLPAPAWFIATDLLLAYLPSAWLGQALAQRLAGAAAARA